MSTSDIASAITTADSVSSGSSLANATSNISIDTDTFLQLLVAQFEYQDPLDPQSDTEFVTQLAQMSTLEEMEDIGNAIAASQAYGLVGQYVYAESTDSDTGETSYYYGIVDSIVNDSGTYYAIVGDDVFEASGIVQIFDPDLMDADTNLVESSNLIGKTITGTYEDDDGDTVEITGEVTKVTCENDVIYAYIDDTRVAVDNITDISSQTETSEQEETSEQADTSLEQE